MTHEEIFTDVVEICALLQCLGYNVRSVNTKDGNVSQDNAARSIVVTCQISGLNVVMESSETTCSCPADTDNNNSGFWQVSGVTGGKKHDTECGSGILGTLPRVLRDRIAIELKEIVKRIQDSKDSELNKTKEKNISSSMLEMSTPEKRLVAMKMDTPTRYRSLDTLTSKQDGPEALPMPGPLQKQLEADRDDNKSIIKVQQVQSLERQCTYTLASTPGSVHRRNKTSSPIRTPVVATSVLESLRAAERDAEELKNKINSIIQELIDDPKNDSSISCLGLDVSKISAKGCETSRGQFLSSPNLHSAGNYEINRLKRSESMSTTNLNTKLAKEKQSKLRQIAPNLFNKKKDMATKPEERPKDAKTSKLQSLFKPRALMSTNTSKAIDIPSPNLNSSKKSITRGRYSTLPKPTLKKL